MWGGRRRAVTRAVVSTMVTCALAGCGALAVSPADRADRGRERHLAVLTGAHASLSTTCPSGSAPAAYQVDRLNAWMSSLDFLPLWRSGDIGFSLSLKDGRIAWVFGDTLRSSRVSPRFVSSSMLITSGRCVAQVVPRGMGPLIPSSDEDSVCWPTAGLALDSSTGDRLLISCSRIERGSGALDFTYLGASMARFQVPTGGVPRLQKTWQITEDHDDPLQINWGSALLHDGGRVYIYGTKLGQVGQSARGLYVARAPADSVDDLASWRYWDGTTWQEDSARVAPILPVEEGVSQALTVDHIGDTYVTVSKKGGDFSSVIGIWTAPAPTGPWHLVHEQRIDADTAPGVHTYAPLAHPNLPLADGDLLVSVSRNPADVDTLLSDPDLGRPVFVDVPMP